MSIAGSAAVSGKYSAIYVWRATGGWSLAAGFGALASDRWSPMAGILFLNAKNNTEL
jgi:allophanate hydrolase subunit 1